VQCIAPEGADGRKAKEKVDAMTEVEFSHLLSELATTAKALNKKSDSVNALISRFQEALRAMNIGIEVWPVTLRSNAWTRDDDDRNEVARGTVDTELGFTKHGGEWVLAVRAAVYEQDAGYNSSYTLIRSDEITRLLDMDREARIESLAHFPEVAKDLKAQADKAIKAIEEAEKFVMEQKTVVHVGFVL